MRTEPPQGDEFDRIIERITGNVLTEVERLPQNINRLPEAAEVPVRRFRRGAVIVAVLVILGVGTAGGAIALVPYLQPAPVPAVTVTVTATPSVNPSPAPTTPPVLTPSAPAVPIEPTVNGYDAQQVWNLCLAYGVGDNSTNIVAEDFTAANVTPARDGDGVLVVIHWSNDAVGDQIFDCVYDGDPSSPTLHAFQVPHPGK